MSGDKYCPGCLKGNHPQSTLCWNCGGELAGASRSVADVIVQLEAAHKFAIRIRDNQHLGHELRAHAAVMASSFESVGRRFALEVGLEFLPKQ